MDKKSRELLYRSLDDPLSPEERKLLDEALKASENLRREKEILLAQREAVSAEAVRSFKPFFAERVMNRIESLRGTNGFEAFYNALLKAFQKFALVGALVMLALIIYNLGTGTSLTAAELLFASDYALEEIMELPLF